VGPYDQQCVITGDRYWIGGCVLLHAIPMYAAMAGLQLCVNLACIYVIRRNWSWADSQPGSGQSPAVLADNGDANGAGLKALPDGADGTVAQESAGKASPAPPDVAKPLT
jgi:hypothetical protein